MKKTTKLLLTLAIIALLGALMAFSALAGVYSGNCGTNVTYKLDTETGILEISGTGKMTNYSSSSSVPWYSNTSYVKTVKISDGVTSIGPWAFYSCSSLTSIEIPDSVTSIGWLAFSNCSSLGSIVIPDSVTSIGYNAFDYCSSLQSIVIPDSVTSIGYYAFFYCSSLTSVTFKTKNATIGLYAFSLCSKLKTIYLYRNSTVDEFFSDEEYTKIYLDEEQKNFGDVNGDGEIDIKDLVLLSQYLAGWNVSLDSELSDCNCDGKINIKDIVLLAQYLANWDVTLG